jgi:serine/threonine-protein kinase
MGVVARAHDVDLDRQVALKTIRRDLSSTPAFAAFFREEARALAALRSPHVVPVHAFGRHQGRFYFVMDLLSGRVLSDLLDDHAARGTTLPLRDALQLLEGIAAGLDDVHAAGLQHRDVKPENVIVDHVTGRPVLVDFGLVARRPWLAGRPGAPAAPSAATAHGGTPGYMAPEICLGHDGITPAADVYAFACTAFELLTGRQVFLGVGPDELLARHAFAPPPPPSSVRAELAPVDGLFARALAKEPHSRPASCGELARALTDALCVTAVVERVFCPPSTPPPEAARADGVSVLVCDSDPREARLVSRAAAFVFHEHGLRIGLTDDPRRLLALASSRAPDLVVLELGPPGSPLLEVLAALRLLHPGAPLRIVVRSDLPTQAVAAWLAPHGVADVIRRGGGIAPILAALEAIAAREGLLGRTAAAHGPAPGASGRLARGRL